MKKMCLWTLCLVATMLGGCQQKGQTASADSQDSTTVTVDDAGIDKHSET